MDGDPLTLRNDLIRKVEDGDLTPTEAEAEAAELGLEPLERTPSLAAFDPFSLDNWTLPMAVAWIAWRTPDAVRENWNAYLAECRWWLPVVDSAAGRVELRERRPASVAVLRLAGIFQADVAIELRPRLDVDDAIARLWSALGRGAVRATGIASGLLERGSIPIEVWPTLEPSPKFRCGAVRDSTTFPYRIAYEHVLLAASDVTRMFQPVPALPPTVPPAVLSEAPLYIPLFSAAHWIATEGNTRDVDWSNQVWTAAYDALIQAAVAGDIDFIGFRDGLRERVDPLQLSIGTVVFPCEHWLTCEATLGEELVLFARPSIGQHAWEVSDGDCLRNRAGPRWSKLVVRASEVRERWAFGEVFLKPEDYRTGAAGRPSPMNHVEQEMRDRAARGELLPSAAKESEALAAWLKAAHPFSPRLGAKGISNELGGLYKALKGSLK